VSERVMFGGICCYFFKFLMA